MSPVRGSFLLLDLRPLLLSGNLSLDERLLTDLAQLDLDDLQRDAFAVELAELLIDSETQLLALRLAVFPESIVTEGGHMLADRVLDPAAVGALIAELQLVVKVSDLVLLEAILD